MLPVLYILLSILCLIGLSTLIRGIAYAFFRADWKAKIVHIVLLDNESPEVAVRDAVEQLRWNSTLSNGRLYALDVGMSEPVKKEAELVLRDYNIEIGTKDNLGKVILKEDGRKS